VKLKDEIELIVQNAIAEDTFSRGAISVSLRNSKPLFVSTGALGSLPISQHTLFDCASVTKVVPTSLLALKALDRGLVSLDTEVNTITSRIIIKSKQQVTFQHLLTQTVEFPFALSQLKELSPEDLLKKITHAEIATRPGSKFSYCNATSIVLGILIEELMGDSLYTLAQKEIFDPLEMNNSHFRPREKGIDAAVPTEVDSWRGRVICGEVHDESAWKLSSLIDPGAAGLFSTSEDLAKIVEMILRNDGTFISEGMFANCYRNWIPEISNDETGLGFEYNQSFMGNLRSDMTMGKTGFTGSSIVIDYKRQAGVSILTDYTWPKRKPDRDQIIRFRKLIMDCVWDHVDQSKE